MKKITTMILTGVFCLALFIPAGCKETTESIFNYGKYADRFDFNDEELYNPIDFRLQIREKISRETPQKTTIIQNGEETEVDIYPCIVEATLKKAEGYPILTLDEIFGYAKSKIISNDFEFENFYYIYKTPDDIPEVERYDGYEEDFRQKVAFILKTPTAHVIENLCSSLTSKARTKINGEFSRGAVNIIKNIEIIFIK